MRYIKGQLTADMVDYVFPIVPQNASLNVQQALEEGTIPANLSSIPSTPNELGIDDIDGRQEDEFDAFEQAQSQVEEFGAGIKELAKGEQD